MSNTNKRTRRTPAELLAAQQEKLARLTQAAAAQSHSDNPSVVILDEAIAAVNKELVAAQRMFSKGPQNLAARKLAHELWISEIQAQERVAQETIRWATNTKQALADARANVLRDLVNGFPIDTDAVRAAVDGASEGDDPILSLAVADLMDAKKHRIASKEKADKENGTEDPGNLASI